jgi:hypothetical protein
MATNETIFKGIGILYMTYTQERERVTEQSMRMLVDVWCDLFADMDDAVFSAAIKQHVKASKWFPKPAEIFEIAKKWEDVADGGDDWVAAWAAVKSAISRYGAWGTTEEVARYIGEKLPASMADDTRALVQRFGWRELCGMEVDQESTWRAQFRDAYTRIRTTRIERQRMPQDVQALIAEMARKMNANRLSAPKKNEDGAA